MNNKRLGIPALVGAPFLFIGYLVESAWSQYQDSSFTGIWGLLYITGWICTMVVYQRSGITGNDRFGRTIIAVIFITLLLANLSNLLQLVLAEDKPRWFFYLDLCWPLSNVLMLPLGIAVIRARKLTGWKRYWPLVTGFWFPVSILALILFGKNEATMMIGGIYSLGAWSLLAYSCFQIPDNKLHPNPAGKRLLTV